LCCAVVPSVVDVTVVTPYESQVTLKVCAPSGRAPLAVLCLLPHTNEHTLKTKSHFKRNKNRTSIKGER